MPCSAQPHNLSGLDTAQARSWNPCTATSDCTDLPAEEGVRQSVWGLAPLLSLN